MVQNPLQSKDTHKHCRFTTAQRKGTVKVAQLISTVEGLGGGLGAHTKQGSSLPMQLLPPPAAAGPYFLPLLLPSYSLGLTSTCWLLLLLLLLGWGCEGSAEGAQGEALQQSAGNLSRHESGQ
jgi:hypothetical protein